MSDLVKELLDYKWREGDNFFGSVIVKTPNKGYENLKEGTPYFELFKCDIYDEIMDINEELKTMFGESVLVKNIKEEDINIDGDIAEVKVTFMWKEV